MTTRPYNAEGPPSHDLEVSEAGQVPAPEESQQEQFFREMEQTLATIPENLRAELSETIEQIHVLSARARESGVGTEDIADFQEAMKAIGEQMGVLVKEVGKKIDEIVALENALAEGIIDTEDVPKGKESLKEFLQILDTLSKRISREVDYVRQEFNVRRLEKEQRIKMGQRLKDSGLTAGQLAGSSVPEFLLSNGLATKKAVYEALPDGEVKNKARKKLEDLEAVEREVHAKEHEGDLELDEYVNRIASALENGKITELFAEDGFDSEKAAAAIADRIRKRALELEGIDNKTLEELPDEVMRHIVDDMPVGEFWKSLEEGAKSNREISNVLVSDVFLERGQRERSLLHEAVNAVRKHASGSAELSLYNMIKDSFDHPYFEGAGYRNNTEMMVRELEHLRDSITFLDANSDHPQRLIQKQDDGTDFPVLEKIQEALDVVQKRSSDYQLALNRAREDGNKTELDRSPETEKAYMSFFRELNIQLGKLNEYRVRYASTKKVEESAKYSAEIARKVEQNKRRQEEEKKFRDTVSRTAREAIHESKKNLKAMLDISKDKTIKNLDTLTHEVQDLVSDKERWFLERQAFEAKPKTGFIGNSVKFSTDQLSALEALGEEPKMTQAQYIRRQSAMYKMSHRLNTRSQELQGRLSEVTNTFPYTEDIERVVLVVDYVTSSCSSPSRDARAVKEVLQTLPDFTEGKEALEKMVNEFYGELGVALRDANETIVPLLNKMTQDRKKNDPNEYHLKGYAEGSHLNQRIEWINNTKKRLQNCIRDQVRIR